ncbi:hypothetical protein LF1_43890 [Rubripirellula obstinata]|uniref:Nucleotidyltransferase n=1 Tax=Rubripirellula obstinata TaxID=406547 RepID=A0A5B1CPP2_9BACT|nr:hypothetical protein [Rubripirellula obstinata]KAA1261829.1 hypothetical protein LF1_43890 [Rubripirellula obstinata]
MTQYQSRAEFLAARDAAMAKVTAGYKGVDATDPQTPSGHAEGIRTSTWLTSDYRKNYRSDALDITPDDVVGCLVDAGVEQWVLMGLHGYVGYLPMPRATQDVDVMVAIHEKDKAIAAVSARWASLIVSELSVVARFKDPADCFSDGRPKPVIDIMLPVEPFYQTILAKHVRVDEVTGHRLPTVEAAIVSKYAAMISPNREISKKGFDGGDLRRIVKANLDSINQDALFALAAEVWDGADADMKDIFHRAVNDLPFEV